MSDTRIFEDELLRRFDEGEEILDYFDTENVQRPNRELKRVNVDFPAWMVEALDNEAGRLGINRQAVIKTWIAERIDKMRGVAAAL
jgi:hypothetical protein